MQFSVMSSAKEGSDTFDPKRILKGVSKQDRIFAEKIERIRHGEYKISYTFPAYSRTVDSLDHISMVQMHGALLEGIYCTLDCALRKEETEFSLDHQIFREEAYQALFIREAFTFREMVQPNELTELNIEIKEVGTRNFQQEYHSVTFATAGFLRGECECVFQK